MNKNVDENKLNSDQIEAINMLEEEGLEFISTPLQIEHGTLMFKDSKLPHVSYSISKTGYARRHINWFNPHAIGSRSGGEYKGETAVYQLNKKRFSNREQAKQNIDHSLISRVLQPGDYSGLADVILRVLPKYRKNNIPNENKQETMRAKTINEDQSGEERYNKDNEQERIKQHVLVTRFENQLTMLIRKYENQGLSFEIATEIFDAAMNEIYG